MEKGALVLIEFQNEWLASEGKLYNFAKDRQQFEAAIAGGREILGLARKARLPIAHCGLRFQPGHPELGGGCNATAGLAKAIPNFGTFVADGTGSRFADDFVPLAGEFVVQGRVGSSGFAGSNLDAWLRNNRVNRVYLAGFALHVCVESTLRAGHDLGYQMVLLQDGCSAFTQAQRVHVLDDVVHHYGEHLTNDQFASELAEMCLVSAK